MPERSVAHATFVIERTYDAAPARVFHAWADREAKLAWSSCHEGAHHELDFRVGGRELYRGGPAGGPVYTVDTRFQELVPNRRIVYTYTMDSGETRISVSLVTVDLRAEGAGTRMVYTEQAVFFDGHDTPAQREHGTNVGMDVLGTTLNRR